MKGKNTVLILGAGASRGVSYAGEQSFPSPLDYDFFDLLQRLNPHPADSNAVKEVLHDVASLPREYWRSFERAFYTLQLRSYLSEKLEYDGDYKKDTRVVTDFALCIHALLRAAHGTNTKCRHHESIITALESADSILSFNYDLVAERAMRGIAESKSIDFGRWIYGLEAPSSARKLPVLLKLHGSSNWSLRTKDGKATGTHFHVRTKLWKDFDNGPGYVRISERETTAFPIFLPFWDKRIERRPWVRLWRNALEKLRSAENVIVWGYSLPPTDVKAYLLFTLGLANRRINLCVIDPKPETRERWRNLFQLGRYWQFESVGDFTERGPTWFG